MHSEEKRRIFFALWPEPATRRELVEAQGGLRYQGKAVAAANLHLTLAFIGEAGSDYLACLDSAAEQISFSAFDLYLNRTGYFATPRILWLGPADPPQALHELQQRLVVQLGTCGYRPEQRPFRPHVTLARKAEAAKAQRTPTVHWRVEGFCLVESQLTSTGAEYRVIRKYPGRGRL